MLHHQHCGVSISAHSADRRRCSPIVGTIPRSTIRSAQRSENVADAPSWALGVCDSVVPVAGVAALSSRNHETGNLCSKYSETMAGKAAKLRRWLGARKDEEWFAPQRFRSPEEVSRSIKSREGQRLWRWNSDTGQSPHVSICKNLIWYNYYCPHTKWLSCSSSQSSMNNLPMASPRYSKMSRGVFGDNKSQY